jgi:excisionase family DNA binding protein
MSARRMGRESRYTMGKAEEIADRKIVAGEGDTFATAAGRFGPQQAHARDGSRPTGAWRSGSALAPRTSEFANALAEDIQQIVREELRSMQLLLQSIADSVSQPAGATHSTDEFLTVDEVAESVKVTPPTVRAWIRSGKLRAINPSAGHRPGHTYRIARGALAQFLAGTEQQPPEKEVDIPTEAARIVEIVARKRKT